MTNTATALSTPLAVAMVVNAIAPSHFGDMCESTQLYRATGRTVAAWVRGPRAVAVNTVNQADFGGGELHAHIAADALDMAYAALLGSPYEVPETASINQVGPRTWEITW